MTITLPFMPSPNFYPGRPQQIQCLIMHSVEGPMQAGLAKSLAGPNWFGSTVSGTSANAIFDQTGGVEMVKPTNRAWHVGNANGWTYGTEHCGYAAFSTAQWLTADGKKMLTASAQWNRQLADSLGIPWVRLTQNDMRAGKRGLATHDDCRVVWGGTTHTDPQWSAEVWAFYLAAGAGHTTPTQPPAEEDDFMSFINNQAEFNAAMTAYFKAAAGTPDLGVRLALDSYFDSRIPDPAHPAPGSISERLANRFDAVLGDPKDDQSLYSKLVRALGKA